MQELGGLGGASLWAHYGPLGLISFVSFSFLFVAARWFLADVRRRDDQYNEERKRKDELFATSIKDLGSAHKDAVSVITSTHEKVTDKIVASLDRLAADIRGGK